MTNLMGFLDYLEKTGDILASLTESGLSLESYNELYTSDVTFRSKVDSAIVEYNIKSSAKLRALAATKFQDLLENGQTLKKVKRRSIYDGDGTLLRTEVQSESLDMGTPEWVIKEVLKRDPVEDALITLANEGLLPKDKVRQVMGALSDCQSDIRAILGETADKGEDLTVNAIIEAQANILGISPDKLRNKVD